MTVLRFGAITEPAKTCCVRGREGQKATIEARKGGWWVVN